MHSFTYFAKNTKKIITKTHLLMIEYYIIFLHIMHS